MDLYELDRRNPVAYINNEGIIINCNDGLPLPQILFTEEIPTMLHLSCGITICPISLSNKNTGPFRPLE